MQGGGFHPRNLVDFTHEIWWISPRFHLWNPPKIIKASVSAKTLQFDECRVGAMTKDFTHEIQWISPRFHLWNPPKIIKASVSAKTLQFDECRVGGYDQGFHLWNLADVTQISPVKSTQNYKSKCFSKNSSVWWMQGGGFHPRNLVDFTLKSGGFHPWNLVDFTQISPVKSTQNYKSKCFSKNSSVWWMQGGCRVGAMTKDFMKSAWNLPDFKIMSFCVMIKYRSFVFRKTKHLNHYTIVLISLSTLLLQGGRQGTLQVRLYLTTYPVDILASSQEHDVDHRWHSSDFHRRCPSCPHTNTMNHSRPYSSNHRTCHNCFHKSTSRLSVK